MYAEEIKAASQELQAARKLLLQTNLPDDLANQAIQIIQKMGIDSLRAEITWFESARAFAAADGRDTVTPADLTTVAPMALRLRRSAFMTEYFDHQKNEEDELVKLLTSLDRSKKQN